MKKSTIYLYFFGFLLSVHTHATMQPWITLTNKTDFDIECTAQGLYYVPENNSENLKIDFSVNEDHNIFVQCTPQIEVEGKNCLQVVITFDCDAKSFATINSLLFCNGIACDLKIDSVICRCHRLQLQTSCNLTKADQRKVIVEFKSDYGINIFAEKISFYVTCAHTFKKTLQNILLTALQAVNYLPY